MAQSTLVPRPHVRALWRPEQFNRIANPGFETNTTGWSVAAGINGAGTSITRITSDSHEGSACGQLVTPATAGTGVNYDLGSDIYYRGDQTGAIYAAVMWLKRISGPRLAKLVLGSQGTSSERDELVITDLADDWRPYQLLWSPRSANVTDAQLALVTLTGEALTVNIDSVALYAPEGFSQIENSTCAADTTGWTATSPGTVSRQTSDPYVVGGAYLRADLTGTTGTFDECKYQLGTRTFLAGRTYRARALMRSVSGNTAIGWRFGFQSSDWEEQTVNLTSSWELHTIDWTPASDYTSGVVCRLDRNNGATFVAEFAHVEVYELLDELGTDVASLRWRRGATFDGASEAPGSGQLVLYNPAGRYAPKNKAATLYGSLKPGRGILARADYDGAGYPLFHGRVRTIQGEPFSAQATITWEDALGSLGRVAIKLPFAADAVYHEARLHAISLAMMRGQERPRSSVQLAEARSAVTTKSHEGDTFYDASGGQVQLGAYLAQLNQATGTVHAIRATYDAGRPWEYITTDRATLTAGANQLANPYVAEVLDGWTLSTGGSGTIARRTDGGPNDEPCLEVTGDGVSFTAAIQTIPVTPGDQVTLTAWVRSTVAADADFFGTFETGVGGFVSDTAKLSPAAADTWERLTQTATVPATAEQMKVKLEMASGSSAVGRYYGMQVVAPAQVVDEDFAGITDYVAGFEALENAQLVAWQGYEAVTLPPDDSFGGTYTWVAKAADVAEAYGGDIDANDPYLHFTDERFGSGLDVPEPEYVTIPGRPGFFGGVGGILLRRRPIPARQERIFPDAFVPFDMAAGDKRQRNVGTNVPIQDAEVVLFDGTASAAVHVELEQDGLTFDITWWATAAETVNFFGISGTPYLPRDAITVASTADASLLEHGRYDGPQVAAYVPSAGNAEGLGAYRNWRYSEARSRLRLQDKARAWDRLWAAAVGAPLQLRAVRWNLDDQPMVRRQLEVVVSNGGHRWQIYHDLEELPAHLPWVTLDDDDRGLDDVAVLAY
jgi:hypothetical protein